ncbi:MAG: hypothetical protein ACR2GW_14835 [Pyrinomonadaceae bacterium]
MTGKSSTKRLSIERDEKQPQKGAQGSNREPFMFCVFVPFRGKFFFLESVESVRVENLSEGW